MERVRPRLRVVPSGIGALLLVSGEAEQARSLREHVAAVYLRGGRDHTLLGLARRRELAPRLCDHMGSRSRRVHLWLRFPCRTRQHPPGAVHRPLGDFQGVHVCLPVPEGIAPDKLGKPPDRDVPSPVGRVSSEVDTARWLANHASSGGRARAGGAGVRPLRPHGRAAGERAHDPEADAGAHERGGQEARAGAGRPRVADRRPHRPRDC
mmetsp:Transcript_61000/g.169119  ORF Transcript_61000/g.169119 Transcript_61000/m.169119 type:complete len:209 (-) Transcript_61000:248-874(-)